jgi:hypothetical protein
MPDGTSTQRMGFVKTFVAALPVPFEDPEGPMEVGLMHETELGMISTVAPSLEEAIEVADSDRMPRPDPGEEVSVELTSLFSAPRPTR